MEEAILGLMLRRSINCAISLVLACAVLYFATSNHPSALVYVLLCMYTAKRYSEEHTVLISSTGIHIKICLICSILVHSHGCIPFDELNYCSVIYETM